ncbi:MAG: AbrB/MazE/SpoVT family DNA-binding domain-containing protein [Terracidiphilus sp.]|jgi:AbrB family looped-hinge helix DNA binding protein
MVTFNGRITLPPQVRKQLGLRTGDSVEFVEIGNGRFAIAPGMSIDESLIDKEDEDPRGWVPQLRFDSTEDEPRFKEPDEVFQ